MNPDANAKVREWVYQGAFDHAYQCQFDPCSPNGEGKNCQTAIQPSGVGKLTMTYTDGKVETFSAVADKTTQKFLRLKQ